jgi:hypothetical protein
MTHRYAQEMMRPRIGSPSFSAVSRLATITAAAPSESCVVWCGVARAAAVEMPNQQTKVQ